VGTASVAAPHALLVGSHGLAEGDVIALLYNVAGKRIWHERVIMHLLPGGTTIVTALAPDWDSYEEDLAPGSDSLRRGAPLPQEAASQAWWQRCAGLAEALAPRGLWRLGLALSRRLEAAALVPAAAAPASGLPPLALAPSSPAAPAAPAAEPPAPGFGAAQL
ncbi:unnamed protein product, partial [Prorocentrum cordatum]